MPASRRYSRCFSSFLAPSRFLPFASAHAPYFQSSFSGVPGGARGRKAQYAQPLAVVHTLTSRSRSSSRGAVIDSETWIELAGGCHCYALILQHLYMYLSLSWVLLRRFSRNCVMTSSCSHSTLCLSRLMFCQVSLFHSVVTSRHWPAAAMELHVQSYDSVSGVGRFSLNLAIGFVPQSTLCLSK